MKILVSLILVSLLSACTEGHTQSKNIKFTKPSHSHHQGKSTGHFKANIQLTYDQEESLEFTAQIQRLRSADRALVKWKLPKGAKLIQGQKTHEIDFADSGARVSKILVDKNSIKPGDQIFLFVYKMANGKKIGVSQSILYQPENNDVEASGHRKKSQKLKKTPKYYE